MAVERVVIAGAGIIGCTIAWRLAQRGVHVTVVEPNLPGQKASWAAAGMLLPMMDPNSPLQLLARLSFQQYPSFVEELRRVTGIDAELQLEAQGGSVDNRKLAQAAYAAGVSAGVDFRMGVSARRVVWQGTRFTHLTLDDGNSIAADAVVIAAGAWSGQIVGLPVRIPVTPVRGQMLAVEHATPLVPHIIKGDACYLVPRGERRTLIGATVERVGFDESVTEAGINGLLMAAYEMVPAVAEARIVEKWAGLRPGTPDDAPIVGADSHVEGVFYATGHFRNGILLAPITARIMADLITEGSSQFHIEDFAIDRFVVPIADPRCDLCGSPMQEWHCRLICTACGYQRDCSDP
ncbi:MAG TPA: FAD-dependent oxidoreductase [Longimicrobiales bacterium]